MQISRLTIANFVIAVILLSSPFIVQLTSSARYDPWADLDGDGDVDIFDIVDIATRYDTKGDATRDVNVVSLPIHSTVIVAENQFLDTHTFSSPTYNTSGFGKLKVMIHYMNGQVQGQYEFRILGWITDSQQMLIYSYPMTGPYYETCLNYPTPCERFVFQFSAVLSSCNFDLSFYMTWA